MYQKCYFSAAMIRCKLNANEAFYRARIILFISRSKDHGSGSRDRAVKTGYSRHCRSFSKNSKLCE